MTEISSLQTFLFLHHGSTDWSDQGLLMGQKDISLNEKGRQEAEEAGKILVGQEIASLCYSPLSRAKETAQIVAKHCNCGLYQTDGLKERLWGTWEGHPFSDEQLLDKNGTLPDGAEEEMTFSSRVREALSTAGTYPSPTLIVSDYGVLKAICTVLDVDCPSQKDGDIVHFFQRLGRWVAKPL